MRLPIIHLDPLNVLPPEPCNNISELVLCVNVRWLTEYSQKVVQIATSFDNKVSIVRLQVDGSLHLGAVIPKALSTHCLQGEN